MSSDTKSTVRRPKRPDWSSLKAAKRKELNHRWGEQSTATGQRYAFDRIEPAPLSHYHPNQESPS